MDEISEPRAAVHVDVISDVVCPWCYIGKRRLESAIALTPDVDVNVNWRPYFLNEWILATALTGRPIWKPNLAPPSVTP